MGYDLYITRADDWKENDRAPITAAEWMALVRADPTLTPDPLLGPYFVRWTGPSRHDDPWLDWRDGNVFSKYPDSALLRKMVAVADRLGARVQGEDGEPYTGDEPLDEWLDRGQGPVWASLELRVPQSTAPGRPWWRRIFDR